VFEVVKHISEVLQKIGPRCYKGPHRALRCGVLDRSSELGIPADFLVLWWIATEPHGLATSFVVLRHFYKKNPQVRLEQLKLSKTDPLTWP
jgi:hypothetical protein